MYDIIFLFSDTTMQWFIKMDKFITIKEKIEEFVEHIEHEVSHIKYALFIFEI